MKKTVLFLLLTAITVVQLSAQHAAACGTPSQPSKWTEAYLQNRQAFEKSNEMLYVPLTIHVVGKDDGSGYVGIKSILDALCELNQVYSTANIQFYINDGIRYINNSEFYNLESTSASFPFFQRYRVSNSINCYIVGTIGSDNPDLVIYGFASGISSNEVVLRNAAISAGDRTWPHELGHALGLYHTFFGWEEFEHNYTENAPTIVNYNRQAEKVDGSNCTTAGDGLCDTSPDYLRAGPWPCNSEGQSTIQQRDPNGAVFRSDGTNIMSYSNNNCQNRFTEAQSQVMRTNLTTQKRSFLNRQTPVPVIDSLRAVLESPKRGDTVVFDAVTLTWNAVPNATQYVVEVSRLSSFPGTFTDIFTTTTNSLSLNSLQNNRLYYWRVRSFNRNSFCGGFTSSSTFRTATAVTTSVDDLTAKATFAVFPNPLAERQSLTIEAELPDNIPLNVRLFDLSGKLLQSARYDAITGNNRFTFTPNNLPKGIYVLNILGNQVNVVQRIMIQ